MLDFLKRFLGASTVEAKVVDSDMLETIDSLDIMTAKAAHENWKVRLDAYLKGTSSEQFSAEVICFDDRCDLGQWIHGQGKARLGKFPGFTALLGHHKMFHYAASNVVALAKAGKAEQAQAMLEGQFTTFSNEVVATLDLLGEVRTAAKSTRRPKKSSTPA